MLLNRIAWLIVKHERNELTADEKTELNAWLDATPANREQFNLWTNPAWVRKELADFFSIDVDAAKRRVFEKIRQSMNGK